MGDLANRPTKEFSKERCKAICHQCGGEMESIVTGLPFKPNDSSIIIIKSLPVIQCKNCNVYLLEDKIMEKVDRILEARDIHAEMEILRFAA